MSAGSDQLKHIVVLMMENRSFDHLLGSLWRDDARIDGLRGNEANPDTLGNDFGVQMTAEYQSELQPDPGHSYEDTDLQINGQPGDAKMKGFIKSYFLKQGDVDHSHKIMHCFTKEKVPVITTLARKFALCNRWFSSLPGPTVPNRAFAHYGTSFGKVENDIFYERVKYPSIYERLVSQGKTGKIYYYDEKSNTVTMVSLRKDQPKLFGTYEQFKQDCASGDLPQYSFLEPNYSDHDGLLAADQHPDHNVLAGEQFIASVYMHILNNESLWKSTLLLVVWDEHGGIFDHVTPPGCPADEFSNDKVGFHFDRLGVRVPAVLISPWIDEGTVIEDVYDHASIPATVTEHFIGAYDERSPREKNAKTFLDVLTRATPREDFIAFQAGGGFDIAPPETGVDGKKRQTIRYDLPPADAHNPDREISILLRDQVAAVRQMELSLPEDQQTHRNIEDIRTEGQASEYIAEVMSRVQPTARVGGAGQ